MTPTPVRSLKGILRRKQLYFYLTLPSALAPRQRSPRDSQAIKAMQPLVDFLNEAILAAKQDEESGLQSGRRRCFNRSMGVSPMRCMPSLVIQNDGEIP